MEDKPECVMLAAGLSSRMGAWKMMLPWDEGTVLDSAIEHALGFCERVILVTGHRADELHVRYGNHPGVTLAYNPDFQQGMFSSVQCGIAQTHGQHFFLALGDMPTISPAVYATLWESRGPYCCVPEFASYRGHPALLPGSMRGAILATPANGMLKSLMQTFGRRSIEVDEPAIHEDVDTPVQYQKLAAEWCKPEKVYG
ncbi:NTP transferase domain-containing protein [Buttiauxella sp. A111]|uniref:NTP transferase domain-containing protein n=1 Tax=Buttiauxella sp. A111 TaxID=2563088 RepID=UPI0010E4DA2B|nr:NTP transferase domain-containing protein [Buttiauxella sp. A111]GDX03871.1 CTP--molybdopterin cytidylyltransferase [Buttiauxella sp. A111]